MHNHQTLLGPWDSDLWQNEHMHRWWSGRCPHVSMAIAVFAARNLHQWQTAHPLALMNHQEHSHWQASTSTAHPPVMPLLAAVESLVIRKVTTESCKVRTWTVPFCLRRLSWLRWNRSWGSIVTGHPSTLTDFFAPSVLTWSFFLKTRSAAVCPSMALKLARPTSLVLLTFSDTSATTPVAMFLRVGSSANGFLSLKICGEDHHVFRVLGWSCRPHLHVLVAGKSSCAGDFLHSSVYLSACWHGKHPLSPL